MNRKTKSCLELIAKVLLEARQREEWIKKGVRLLTDNRIEKPVWKIEKENSEFNGR